MSRGIYEMHKQTTPEPGEVLNRAITIAVHNGWFPAGPAMNARDTLHWIRNLSTNDLVYNQTFAKALWSTNTHDAVIGIDDYGEEDCASCHNSASSSVPYYCWQYHLQQMVIANDPIQYLAEHLPA